MKKKALSLALALVMCLGLTVPAFAAGTSETIYAGSHGGNVTVSNVLRKEEVTYQIKYDFADQPFEYTETFYIVSGEDVSLSFVAPEDGWVEPSVYVWDQSKGWFFDPYYSSIGDPIPNEDSVPVMLSDIRTNLGINNDAGQPLLFAFSMVVGEGGPAVYIMTERDYTVAFQGAPATVDPTVPAENIPASGTAYASTQTVTVDGKKVEFQMYALKDANGNGTNYIKLRDMAYVLNGTAAQFSVGYDNAAKSISVTSGEGYEAAGSEMTTPFSGDRSYTGGAQAVQVNGKAVDMTAITLLDDAGGGYNYFKLRDLGKALGFNVGWSKEAGVFIETDKPYAE